MSDLLLTYYGDDLTGSTDVMESLTLGGVPTMLFLDAPKPEFLNTHFPDARAVGVAGISRSMSPAQMDAELPGQFAALKHLNAPILHYKVCSTFDSSPTIGSIGQAIEIAWNLFQPDIVPLVVGSPWLKRYVVFGNLFARVGDITYRIDRHPTMSKHPITPMDEGDLRLHLGKQTARKIGLIDVLSLDNGEADAQLDHLRDEGAEIILFDTLEQHHLETIGRMLWQPASQSMRLVVGSSGVENALTAHWQAQNIVAAAPAITPPDAMKQMVVMSGSASPVTAGQIQWAMDNGFQGIRLDSAKLVHPHSCDEAAQTAINEALAVIASGDSVILYSALGPDDTAVAETKNILANAGTILARQQGRILKSILEKSGLKRVCVAGGDTSGHTARQLGIYALTMQMPIAPGAPLCRAYSNDAAIDGIEISLKGGQNGSVDYFGAIQRGHA
jgi:3-oxoisoapionate kinase